MDFIIGPFLIWLPKIFFWLIFAAVLIYYFRHKLIFLPPRLVIFFNFKNLVFFAIGFRIFYSLAETFLQYYVWSLSGLTRLLLNSPLNLPIKSPFFFDYLPALFKDHLGYFLFYSYMRFWLNLVVVLLAAAVFYLFLKMLQKYRARFFEDKETSLGFLSVLLVGWPQFIVFLPLVFISVIIFSVFRRIAFKEFYTTLGAPMLLSILICLIWGNVLLNSLGLIVFKI